jgi:peroxiredoxin (alkyl hydroperoxide reductase subunit C)
MVLVGSAAPPFDCQAVVHGTLRPLRWPELHAHQTLLLLFDPPAPAGRRADWTTLNEAAERLHGLPANLAVVCRAGPSEVLAWANGLRGNGGPGALAFPLLADGDGHVAWLYDLLRADGRALWGRFLIDPGGVVRQAALSDFPIPGDADELVRFTEAVAHAGRGDPGSA